MNDEIIITGKTVEEAMALAAAQYGGENVSYDIVEMPKKGFLGIGASPAKIRVTVNKEEEIDLSDLVTSVKSMKVATNKGGSGETFEKKKEAKPEKKPRPEKTEKTEKVEKTERPERKERPAKVEKAASGQPAKEPRVIVVTDEEKAFALEFANNLLKNMGVDATAAFDGIETAGEGGTTYPRLVISGDGAGILIGHHGETLDAIQYLVNLSALRRGGNTQKEFVKIVVDIENYRKKREETLRALARRMAIKAQKYKRNVVLEPMNPYERRIIHSEIQGFENVSTHSVGSDENRKIIVTYEGADKVERRPRSRYNQRPRRENVAAESVTVEDAASFESEE